MNYQIDIEIKRQSQQIPSQEKCEAWIAAVLKSQELQNAEVSLYIVDEKESRNSQRYRIKSKIIKASKQIRNCNYPYDTKRIGHL